MEYMVHKGSLSKDGNKQLKYKICTPVFDGCEELNSFFAELSRECESFCRERLSSRLKLTSREIYSYTMLCSITHNDGIVACIIIQARLSLGAQVLFENKRAISLDLAADCLLPPSLLYKKYASKGQKFKKSQLSLLYLQNNRLRLLE